MELVVVQALVAQVSQLPTVLLALEDEQGDERDGPVDHSLPVKCRDGIVWHEIVLVAWEVLLHVEGCN